MEQSYCEAESWGTASTFRRGVYLLALQGKGPHSQKYIHILQRTRSCFIPPVWWKNKLLFIFTRGEQKLSKESQICGCFHPYLALLKIFLCTDWNCIVFSIPAYHLPSLAVELVNQPWVSYLFLKKNNTNETILSLFIIISPHSFFFFFCS